MDSSGTNLNEFPLHNADEPQLSQAAIRFLGEINDLLNPYVSATGVEKQGLAISIIAKLVSFKVPKPEFEGVQNVFLELVSRPSPKLDSATIAELRNIAPSGLAASQLPAHWMEHFRDLISDIKQKLDTPSVSNLPDQAEFLGGEEGWGDFISQIDSEQVWLFAATTSMLMHDSGFAHLPEAVQMIYVAEIVNTIVENRADAA